MHGEAVLCPFAVRAKDIELPDTLQAVSAFGRSFGVLAYVRYQPPSPLCYDELIWMPCLVTARGARGPKGYFVARMYVNNAATLAGGRELWALPKSLAEFRHEDGKIHVAADDGTTLTLSYRARGPALAGKTRVGTLQADGSDVVRFRGDFRARIGPATLSVKDFATRHVAWQSFSGATRLSRPAVLLSAFSATMHPATRVPSPSGVKRS
jgi:hypothetical protein